MRVTITTALCAALGALCLAVPAGAAEPVTDAQYQKQVNPICKKAEAEARRIPKRIQPSGDPGYDTYRAARLFSRLLGRTTTKIARVKPPPARKEQVGAWVKGMRAQKRVTDRSLSAAKAGDIRRAQRLARKVSRLENQNSAKAKKIGVPACG